MNNASSIEVFLLGLMNEARSDAGLAPLTLERNLNEAAEDYSALLLDAGHFDHVGPDGSTMTQRMEDADYDFGTGWGAGENLAVRTRGSGPLEADVTLAFEGLMNSPGHRANILNPDFTHVGLGIELAPFDPYGGRLSVMVTQNFGYSNGVADEQHVGTSGADVLASGPGTDFLQGLQGDDRLTGGTGSDVINAGGGDDTVDAGGGNDRVRGGNGADLITLGDGRDRFFDTNQGGIDGSDTVNGGAGRDLLVGAGGGDSLSGGDGADTILGGAGNDTLNGGSGADRITGGAGNDRLTGGAGRDVFVFEAGGGEDRVTDFESGKDALDVSDWAGVVSFSDLTIAASSGNAVVSTASDRVVLLATDIDDIGANDFLF